MGCSGDTCEQPDTCYDSDGGDNKFEPGFVEGYYQDQPYLLPDYCTVNDDTQITEWICNNDIPEYAATNCLSDGDIPIDGTCQEDPNTGYAECVVGDPMSSGADIYMHAQTQRDAYYKTNDLFRINQPPVTSDCFDSGFIEDTFYCFMKLTDPPAYELQNILAPEHIKTKNFVIKQPGGLYSEEISAPAIGTMYSALLSSSRAIFPERSTDYNENLKCDHEFPDGKLGYYPSYTLPGTPPDEIVSFYNCYNEVPQDINDDAGEPHRHTRSKFRYRLYAWCNRLIRSN